MDNFPKVGVGVIIIKDNKILFGQRKNAHGEDTWSVPGGHLEFNESIEECAKREVFEETGIEIKNLKIGPFTNDIFEKEQKHYITIYVIADYNYGKVEVKEPDKMIEWNWFSWNNLPKPLFKPIENLLKQNFNPLI